MALLSGCTTGLGDRMTLAMEVRRYPGVQPCSCLPVELHHSTHLLSVLLRVCALTYGLLHYTPHTKHL